MSIPDELIVECYKKNKTFKTYCEKRLFPSEIASATQLLITKSPRVDINFRQAFSTVAKFAQIKYLKKQNELNSAYAYLTNKIPEIYQFPSCLDVRITSSNLMGELVPLEKVTLSDFGSRAAKCNGNLCIGLVGKKIAAVCQENQ